MAKDDYYVIAYKILAYLYKCLKDGNLPDLCYLTPGTDRFPVKASYWHYIMQHLYEDGYIEGVMVTTFVGSPVPDVRPTDGIMITPLGIEFLQNNSAMSRARDFLKAVKDMVPGW